MIMVNNPFGQDPMDFDNDTAASRIGSRIRKIRIERGLSQAELGNLLGLTADRIQKYENGARKPKTELLKQIASVLGVSTLALVDPNTTSYIGALYAMFELEEHFNLKIEPTGENHAPGMCLTVDFRDELYNYMKEWQEVYSQTQAELEAASSEEEKSDIIKSYHDWQWNFPQGIVDKTTRDMKKVRLNQKIDELQKVYEKLDGE